MLNILKTLVNKKKNKSSDILEIYGNIFIIIERENKELEKNIKSLVALNKYLVYEGLTREECKINLFKLYIAYLRNKYRLRLPEEYIKYICIKLKDKVYTKIDIFL